MIFSNKNMFKSFKAVLISISLLSISAFVSAEKMWRTHDNTPIYAQIGDEYRKVGDLSLNFPLTVNERSQAPQDFLAISFGNSAGFISNTSVVPNVNGENMVKYSYHMQGYIITTKSTALYAEMGRKSRVIAHLDGNLRYPFIQKPTDEQGKLWYQVALAGQIGYIKAADVQPDNGIPVIIYHHVLQDKENQKYRNTPTTVSTDDLNFQFATMKELKFKTASLSDLEGYLQGKVNLPAKTLILTFDDGLKSVYRYVYPLLKKYDFQATLFVITSRIQSKPQQWEPNSLQFLSAEEYREMHDSVDLQSHSHSLHHYIKYKPAAPQTDYQTLYIDLVRSTQELARLNSHAKYLAYPFGVYTEEFIAAAKNSGFTLAVTTKWGKVKFGDDPMLLKRLYFTSDTTKEKINDILKNQ
ncbi:MAG TPA: hypothetical protein DD638_08040 [Pasteurellaceae bacterium]|nr:hypothetical protein [Pasteurellaceae bacterium]